MNTPSVQAPSQPILDTDAAILTAVRRRVGKANQKQLWFMFVDANDRMAPVIMPVSGIPLYPHEAQAVPSLGRLLTNIRQEIAEPTAELIAIYERPGRSSLSDADRCWIRTISSAAFVADVPVRALLLSHSGGVTVLPKLE